MTTTTLDPTGTYTFTIASEPTRDAQRKTIKRLMEMQPEVQRGLAMLSKRRATTDNDPRRRAGRIWIHRKRRTNLVKVAVGETFTLRLTPQILPDINSVRQFLDVK
jgi:hypothetical protein